MELVNSSVTSIAIAVLNVPHRYARYTRALIGISSVYQREASATADDVQAYLYNNQGVFKAYLNALGGSLSHGVSGLPSINAEVLHENS